MSLCSVLSIAITLLADRRTDQYCVMLPAGGTGGPESFPGCDPSSAASAQEIHRPEAGSLGSLAENDWIGFAG